MSVSQFPNATIKKAEDIMDLCDMLIAQLDPALEPDLDLIMAAGVCAICEATINHPKLSLYHKLDPAILAQIKSDLDSCR